VRIAPPEAMEEELASFRPHLLVHNDSRSGPVPGGLLEAVPCRVEVLYSDGIDARLYADGRTTEVRDASTEDLLAAVDAAPLADGEYDPG
jgi:hypothetical protein